MPKITVFTVQATEIFGTKYIKIVYIIGHVEENNFYNQGTKWHRRIFFFLNNLSKLNARNHKI